MRSILAGFVTATLVVLGLLPLRPAPVAEARATGDDARAFMQTYCITCHSQQMKSRGAVPVALDTLDASAVASDAKTWEQVVRKMRAGVMPPAGMKRPDKAAHEQFLAWVEGELDRAARERPNPGRTEAFHRLNRTEYRNAVRDLLDLDVDVTGLAAARRRELRLRQHRRRAEDLADAARAISVGGTEGQSHGARHRAAVSYSRLLSRR